MHFIYSSYLLIILFGFVQVYSKGYHCKKYITIKHGDRCRYITNGYEYKKGFYITSDNLFKFNPCKYQ